MSKKNHIYSTLDSIDYSCNKGFEIVENKKIFGYYSGKWSTKSTILLVVFFPVLLFPLLAVLTTIVLRRRITLI